MVKILNNYLKNKQRKKKYKTGQLEQRATKQI